MLISGTPGITHPRPGPPGLAAAFPRRSHDREDFTTLYGLKAFAIMERLVRCHVRESHPPLRAHFPRIPGTFTAGHVIVWSYPPYCDG